MSATTQFPSDVSGSAPFHPVDQHASSSATVTGHHSGSRRSNHSQSQHHSNDHHQVRPSNGTPAMNNLQQRSSQGYRSTNSYQSSGAPSTSSSGHHAVPPPYALSGNPTEYRPSSGASNRSSSQTSGGAIRHNQQRQHPTNPPPYAKPLQPGAYSKQHQQQPMNVPPLNTSAQQNPQPQHHMQPLHSIDVTRRPINPVTGFKKDRFHLMREAVDICSMVPNDHFEYMRVEETYYQRLLKIGQGTFGEVFKAKCVRNGTIVALKKILMENEKEGFPITALREINMLKSLRHPNVTELVDICSSGSKEKNKTAFFLVFAFCDHDLAGILSKKDLRIDAADAKTMLRHLFLGLAYIHGCEVLHRDMKTANILVTKEGVLKLADFGLARPIIRSNSGPCYTNRVVTMWYRPPELLLGERNYSGEIDIWGAGCIMVEFWTRTPIFQGNTEQHQLQLICKCCGSINESTMRGCNALSNYSSLKDGLVGTHELSFRLKKVVKCESAINLIDRILSLEPSNRPTAAEALKHPYFNEAPFPKPDVSDLMRQSALQGRSLFEFTSNSGAHRKPVQRPPRPMAPPQLPRNQMFDHIF